MNWLYRSFCYQIVIATLVGQAMLVPVSVAPGQSIASGFISPTRLIESKTLSNETNRFFQTSPRLILGSQENLSASVRLADFDCDGDLDAVVANGRHWPQQNFVLLNQGAAKFNVQIPLGEAWMTSYATEVGDLDGDGDLDIAVGNDLAPNLIFLSDGKGRFDSGTQFGKIASIRSLTLADIDCDGDLDILTTCRGQPNQIFLNDGRSKFTLGGTFGEMKDSTIDVAVADFNEDGQPDLILANRDGQRNYCLLNDGKLNFIQRVPLGTGEDQSRAVAVADMNQDGHVDIVVGNIGQANAIYFGDGKGAILSSIEFGGATDPTYCLAADDMNNDGLVDLVVGNAGSVNAVYFNLGGDKGFRESRFGAKIDATYGLAIGDLDGDGWKDIVVANSGTKNLIFINRPVRN